MDDSLRHLTIDGANTLCGQPVVNYTPTEFQQYASRNGAIAAAKRYAVELLASVTA